MKIWVTSTKTLVQQNPNIQYSIQNRILQQHKFEPKTQAPKDNAAELTNLKPQTCNNNNNKESQKVN